MSICEFHIDKRSLALMVGFPVVKSVHPRSSLRFCMGFYIYLDLFQNYLVFFLVIGDVSVNSEASVVTLSTLRSADSVL
jgi:hypothetical protein